RGARMGGTARSDRLRPRAIEALANRGLLAAVVDPGALPGPPLARRAPTERPHAEGAHVRSDRRSVGSSDDVVAGGARGRAQLGLQVLVGSRLDVRTVGSLHPRVRPRGGRLLLLHRRT